MDSKLNYHFVVDHEAANVEFSSYQRYTVDRGIDSSRTVHFSVEDHTDNLIDLSSGESLACAALHCLGSEAASEHPAQADDHARLHRLR